MNLDCNKNLNSDNNITQTGYRALFILLKLIESPKTREELHDCFLQDSLLKKDCSKDTITYTVNALRVSGCIISRPSQRIKNKYILKYHPYSANLPATSITALQEFRKSIVTLGDWKLLFQLNDLYAKFAEFTTDEEAKNILIYNHPFAKINIGIVNELIVCINFNKLVNITYNSPKNGEEAFDIIPECITFENEKLYVWGYCYKHDQVSYLRIDRITRINFVNFYGCEEEKERLSQQSFDIEYKLKGYSALMFIENRFETILERDERKEYSLHVKAQVKNKFNYIQRILSFGPDCKIISPQSFTKEIIKKLTNLKTEYTNESE